MTRQIIQVIFILFLTNCCSTKNTTADKSKSTDPNYLVTGYYYLSKDSNKFQRQLYGTTRKYYLNPAPIITVDNFTSASIDQNKLGGYYIGINLDEAGGQKWSEAIGKTIGDSLAIIVNNELVQVAKVNAQITAPVTAINRGGLTKSQADKYLEEIKAKMTK
ncbi:MAG: hypothetical protein ABI199_07415 [Bacteroidia bacterium]